MPKFHAEGRDRRRENLWGSACGRTVRLAYVVRDEDAFLALSDESRCARCTAKLYGRRLGMGMASDGTRIVVERATDGTQGSGVEYIAAPAVERGTIDDLRAEWKPRSTRAADGHLCPDDCRPEMARGDVAVCVTPAGEAALARAKESGWTWEDDLRARPGETLRGRKRRAAHDALTSERPWIDFCQCLACRFNRGETAAPWGDPLAGEPTGIDAMQRAADRARGVS